MTYIRYVQTMLFTTAGIPLRVTHHQRLSYCTVVLGTAVDRKVIQSTRSKLWALTLSPCY